MTHGSLFSGIGGIDLGFERAGIETLWQVEQDDYCTQVLEKHWPGVQRFRDVRECGAANLAPVDIIGGGFLCQPVSLAGKRRGQDDPRWLWPEFARIVRELRPRYVVVENVPGLLHLGMGDVLGDLAASGYDAEWDCLPAAAFGAPHIRDRVWLLAYSRQEPRYSVWWTDGRHGRPFLLPKTNDRETPERREHRELIALVPGVHPRVAADWWATQSVVARTTNGLPRQLVDGRNSALGEAVVPQVAEWLGRRIVEADAQR